MSRVKVVTTARCLVRGCDWKPEGDVDLAARRHTGERGVKGDGAGHPTVVEAVAQR